MARQIHDRDISATLAAAEQWIRTCLIEDGSVFSEERLWTPPLVSEVHHAFDDHPDYGSDDFMTKLKGQMKNASRSNAIRPPAPARHAQLKARPPRFDLHALGTR